ncbi:MAG TPA: tetratricopeptide repeat protein [Desulfobacterales bacterium]|nr:tetratricopeptide repeat protein [Desulfobacterales bacterium]
MHAVKPTLYSILISVNDQTQSLLSGEKLTVHPRDRLKILKISTNVPFNIGIRLYCKMFDAQSLVYDEMRVADLLSEEIAFKNPTLRIQVKYYNQEAGHVVFLVRPFVGDWLEKASRTIDKKKRIALLEEAMNKVPGSEEIRQRLLKEYIEAEQLKQAAKLLEQTARKAPSRNVLEQLLQLYRKAGDTNGVILTLERLIDLDPKDKESRYALARLLEKKGRLSRAIAQYKAVVKLATPEEKLDLYVQLGYLNAKAGRTSEAVRYYEKASALHAEDANIYYNLSYLYDKLGKRDKADFYLEKAVKLRGSDIEGRIRLAQDWIKEGKFKKAKPLLIQVLKKNPKSMKALLLMMQVAEKTGDKAELKKTYRRILKLQPKNATVIYNLGALEYEAGRLKSARYYLERYLAIKTKDKTAHTLLFDIYKQLKQTDKAIKEAQILFSLGQRDPDLLAYLFEALRDKKDYGKIESLMLKALKRKPNNPQIHKYLLFAYLQLGKEKQAMAEMEKILKLEPRNVELWLHLARLREKNKKYGEAMAAYKKVIELDPENEEASEAYLKLRLRGFEEKMGK